MGKKASRGGRKEHGEIGGFLDSLGSLLGKLGDLAEKGSELGKSGEFQDRRGRFAGVYGFNVKVGLGDKELEVEPFGNVRRDERTGEAVVTEVREPMVDVLDEEGHVLVVAEMPGVGEEDVRLELVDDIMTIVAEKGDKKYRKEVLLPRSLPPEQMSHTCRNGVLEVRIAKQARGEQEAGPK